MDIITDCQDNSDLCSPNYILKMASLMKSEGIKNYIFIILNLFSYVIYELIQKVFTFFWAFCGDLDSYTQAPQK